MATINSKQIVDDIMAEDTHGGAGYFYDDPPVYSIVEYSNVFNGGIAYGLCFSEADRQRYFESSFCHNPREIFHKIAYTREEAESRAQELRGMSVSELLEQARKERKERENAD